MFKPKITPFNYISQNYFVWNSKAMLINHHLIWKQDMAPQADPEGQAFWESQGQSPYHPEHTSLS